MKKPNSTFLQELSEMPGEHPLFQRTHPFWRNCFRGRLAIDGLRQWGLSIYPGVRDFPQLYLIITAKCDCERTLTLLSETIYEETGSGQIKESHSTLFRNFLQGLGLSREEMTDPAAIPTSEALWNHYWKVVRNGSFMNGLALVGLAIEGPLAKFAALFVRAMQRHYGLTSEALKFHSIHQVADVKHSHLAAQIVADLAVTPDLQTQVREVLFRTWDLQQAHLDALHQSFPAE